MQTIEPDMDVVAAMFAKDDGGPVAMVNLLRFRERALYDEGSAEAAERLSGREAYRRYADAFVALIEEHGARTVFWGDSEAYFIGDGDWDAVWINHFPNLAALAAASTGPRYEAIARHRSAGLAHQHAIMTRPLA